MSTSRILFQLTGSIACFKACAAISQLVQNGHEVKVVATPSALRFVGEATLEGLAGHPVYKEVFQSGGLMDHIRLAEWCDIGVLCPATAGSLNRLSAGLADDLIGTLFLAFDRSKPYFVVPAMNTRMWDHPSVTHSIDKLRQWGVTILEPQVGRLACGAYGAGKMVEPEDIVSAIEAKQFSSGKRILITSGGTREPIDPVRCLANNSTGQTGADLAEALVGKGHAVTLIHAQNGRRPNIPVPAHTFETSKDLDHHLRELLAKEEFDAVIHAAAVSDFVPLSADRKMDSSHATTVTLRPATKILPRIKSYSKNPKLTLVAFKLTTQCGEKGIQDSVQRVFESGADYVVHNDTATMRFGDPDHPCTLFCQADPPVHCGSHQELAHQLHHLIVGDAS